MLHTQAACLSSVQLALKQLLAVKLYRIPTLQAAALLDEGKQKYNNGDKMGALKLFDRCLEKVRASKLTGRLLFPPVDKLTAYMVVQQAPSQEQRQAALFNSTAVHASFGDIELAQITLRGAVRVCPDLAHSVEA